MPWSRRGSLSHHLRSTITLVLSLALLLVLAAPNLNIVTASAQSVPVKAARTKNCQCEFDTKDYDAYGTNGACGIFMHDKAHTCEVSFSGTGANAKLINDTLGENALQNQFTMAPQIFERYLAYIRGGEKDPKLFADASFIEKSLVVLARATVFRESAASTKLPLKDIDALFSAFSKENSKRIAETFAGTGAPFTTEVNKDVTFSVGRGYVELNFHSLAKVRVVYFSEETR